MLHPRVSADIARAIREAESKLNDNRKAAEYRLYGNPEAARHIRHQYRDIARQCLEEWRGLRDALNATKLAAE